MNAIQMYAIYLIYVLILAVILSMILNFIGEKFRIKYLNKAANFFGYIAFICLSFYILYMFYSAFFATITVLYTLSHRLFIWVFNIPKAATYLSLFVALLIIAYVPEKLGYYFLRFLERVVDRSSNLSEKYIVVVKFLRLKLWIYMFSFWILLISSLEGFTDGVIIQDEVWRDFRPVILQAVVTFIAFDRFINLLVSNLPAIKHDIGKVKTYLNKIFAKEEKVDKKG